MGRGESRLQSSLAAVKQQRPDQVDVPPERQFVGLDAYKKAMGTLDKGSIVLLTTPPAFRPMHVEYAVAHDLHVFMEKSFAVDAPGIRRILKCGEEAKRRNLKIAGGLMERHSAPLAEAMSLSAGLTASMGRSRPPGAIPPGTNWPARSPITAISPGSTAPLSWIGSSTILTWPAGSRTTGRSRSRAWADARCARLPINSSITMKPNSRSPTARAWWRRAG